MTKVAVLSDIHANPPALEAVISDLDLNPVDEVIVGGDLVGRGPMGSDIVERIRELGWRSLRGNHEDYLLAFARKNVPEEWLGSDEWAAARWMADELSEEAIEFIADLEFSKQSRLLPNVEVFHGSPVAYDDGIGPWTSEERLREYLGMIEGSILVCAHIHRPMIRELPEGLVLNTGAVGLPFDGTPEANYLRLTREDGRVIPEIRSVSYSRESILETYETSGFIEEGGLTARLLQLELMEARPVLVPFLKWAEYTSREHSLESLRAFLSKYDPERGKESVRELIEGEDTTRMED